MAAWCSSLALQMSLRLLPRGDTRWPLLREGLAADWGKRALTDQAGEALSLSEVLEGEKERFMRFLIARTRDPALSEDLFQDACAKALSLAEKQVENPVPYLFQMLANLVEDHRRSERAREARGRQWGDRGEGLEPQRADHLTPEHNALDRDMLARVLAEIEMLPERTRTIFLAYRVEGMSQKEIAAQEQLSLSAVEKHLQRAYRAVIAIREKLSAGLE